MKMHLRESRVSVEVVRREEESPSNSGTSCTDGSRDAPEGNVGERVFEIVQDGCNVGSRTSSEYFKLDFRGVDRLGVCDLLL